MSDPWYASELACPDCQTPIRESQATLTCECGFTTAWRFPFDLRPQNATARSLSTRLLQAPDIDSVLIERPNRADYEGPSATRDSSELFAAALPWLSEGKRLLDVGCGPRDQAVPTKYFKVDYVGLDYSSGDADLLADAHAIPFVDRTFDAVISYAVLEHLQNPFLATVEIARVLRDDGVFFGTVAQGEPYHVSYFHLTVLGLLTVLRSAGFELLRLWPSYDTLHALASMGRYPRAIRAMIELVHRVDRSMPFLAPRAFFTASKRAKDLEEIFRAAGLCFVAVKKSSR